MRLFLDSGAFIARALIDDRYHRAAEDTFTRISRGELPYRQMYTSNYVIDETLTFLLYQGGPRIALDFLDRARSSPILHILRVTEDVEKQADRFFRRFATSRVSYTDCTSKVLMEREDIDTAFTFDRDFALLGIRRIP